MSNKVSEIQKGTAQLLPLDELENKLKNKKQLCVKLGVDPTAPDLHLGHAIVLGKLKQFQDMGHRVIFLIGDYTTKIGDPTGKSKVRPSLSDEEIKQNTQTYFDQVNRILDPKKTEVRYNSEWLSKLSFEQLIKLCAKVTVSQLIEREDFSNRLKNNQSISFHELLYPLMQGYDSVALDADIELGGTDQTFNLLMGRHLQEQFGKEPQVILTMPILVGLDGTHKMSKSLNNAIGLTEAPSDVYGKLMSISDDLMWHYYEMLLDFDDAQISEAKKIHPMDAKKQMAYQVVAKYWSDDDAKNGQQTFEKLFQKKDYSAAQEVELQSDIANPIWIVDLLRALGAIKTSSDARRLIGDGAVKIDGRVVSDFKEEVKWQLGMVIKVGKHRIYQIK